MRLQRMFSRPWWFFWVPLLLALEAACLLLVLFSERTDAFAYESDLSTRPILEAVAILGAASVVYLVGIWGLRHGRPPVWFVLVGAVALRAPFFFSDPILEDDCYRYLWDGKVSAAGVDPYKFSPEEVLLFEPDPSNVTPSDLARVAELRDASTTNEIILERVNNPSFHTIYPFVAQLVFLVVGAAVSDDASIAENILALRLLLLAFDLGTLILLVRLLVLAGQPAAAAIAYGWCPLVVKEITNSAHFDVVPCFFVVLALVSAIGRRPIICGLGLALAILSKYYAIVVFPFALLLLARTGGARSTGTTATGTTSPSSGDTVRVEPNPPGSRTGGSTSTSTANPSSAFRFEWNRTLLWCGSIVIGVLAASRLVLTETAQSRHEVLNSFLLQWEMHDAVFMWICTATELLRGAEPEVPNAEVARWIVGAVFALLALGFLVRVYFRVERSANGEPSQWAGEILGSTFAVLGVLFILSPVGFPWYFLWCVPLLPFARRKSWYLLTGLLFVYYLRFWFAYGTPQEPRAFFGYPPEQAEFFFHHWVVSIEFGLFFLAWIAETTLRPSRPRALTSVPRPRPRP